MVSRAITFREHLFPFKEGSDTSENPFLYEPVMVVPEESVIRNQNYHSQDQIFADNPGDATDAINTTLRATEPSILPSSTPSAVALEPQVEPAPQMSQPPIVQEPGSDHIDHQQQQQFN
ncbi:hypothetical protein A4A49_19926 [Nicotiana attenuata]|uniref:Uncharacterized protein n=1 Tax=Nicotiana attenuata TaxID=49451 RepID=A0A314L816_NICAT|nr:hypothetical protein A4A49_19926 [Nicotiana attenuata]